MSQPLELAADCPACRVDGAALELYDPDAPVAALGLPVERRCRLCGGRWEGTVKCGPDGAAPRARGHKRCPCCADPIADDEVDAHACGHCGARGVMVERVPPADLTDRSTFVSALTSMARDDGEPDLAAFLTVNFFGRSLDELHGAISRGERVESGLDALYALFSRAPGRGGAGGTSRKRLKTPEPPRDVPPVYEPRAMLMALVSVLVADGAQDPREIAFVDNFLRREGLSPLRPEELRVHRPVEIAGKIPPARRAEVVELMVQLACVDGEADPSELRLLASYAASWGIDQESVDGWVAHYRLQNQTDAQRFLRRLRSFFVAPRERAGEPGSERRPRHTPPR